MAAQVVLAVLFGALWWSGLVAPRLSVGDSSHGSYDTASGRATANLSLRNDSLVAVEVRGVALGGGRVTVDSVRVNGRDIATGGQRLAGGDTATLMIELTCHPTEGDVRLPTPPMDRIRLEVTVRTPIGLERTRSAGTVQLAPACRG